MPVSAIVCRLAFWGLLVFGIPHLEAGDVVRIAPVDGKGPPFGMEGEILDYTGREILIRPLAGPQRHFAADRVVEIETVWPSHYERGLRALESEDYSDAAESFSVANREEQRPWARRIILGKLARAVLGLGQQEQASEIVLAILASDPTSAAIEWLPLDWIGSSEVPPTRAEAWLQRSDEPAAVLLGASLLLSTDKRVEASLALSRLTSNQDMPIAALAEAQLWRTRIPTADAAEVDRWQAAIERLPKNLRAGPYSVLGHALRKLGRHDEATLALLRVPVHAPHWSDLSARALFTAAEWLEHEGRSQEAARLAREVVRDYAHTPSARPAEEMVRRLDPAQ